jgi:predicted O-methyltransferase YrrM
MIECKARPLAPLANFPPDFSSETLQRLRSSSAYRDLLLFFRSWPPQSFMSDDSRAILYALIRTLHPKVVAEIGTLFAGTTEVMARALWENGHGVIHTTDPFGADRCPAIIAEWPSELQTITNFHPLNSMDFFCRLEQQKVALNLVLVDGNHDFEFALFDLQMAARLVQPGGIIVMDNAEQSGPFRAARTFIEANPAWQELGSALATYDPGVPFEPTRASVPGTTFIILQSPTYLWIGPGPHSWGQLFMESATVDGMCLHLATQKTAGTLFYQAIFRAFGDENRAGAEHKSLGGVRVDANGEASMLAVRFPNVLHSDMAVRHADARFSFEIDLSWKADPGAPPLALQRVPSPFYGPQFASQK